MMSSSRSNIAVRELVLVWCVLSAVGCRDRMQSAGTDLADAFEAVDPASPAADSFMRHLPVERRGSRKDAMVLVAPIAVRARLGGRAGAAAFRSAVTPVFNVGDGLRFEVLHVSGGKPAVLYSRTLDAARRFEDRQWLPIEVPIPVVPGGDAYIEIRVSGGRRGDLVGDWLALAEMRLEEREGT